MKNTTDQAGSVRHFLTLSDLTASELQGIVDRAIELKAMRSAGEHYMPLKSKSLAMIFEKSSTRTRVSFEAGMAQLGGHALFLSSRDTQLGRGEPIADTAKVLSRMVDAVMIRNDSQAAQVEFAAAATVPVINALSDEFHPCQLLADMMVWQEHHGSIAGKVMAWIGDANNVCNSVIKAAGLFDFQLRIAAPEGYQPDAKLLADYADNVSVVVDAAAAAKNADVVTTDVWASMGQEQEQNEREAAFADYQVNADIMVLANPNALFLHCLPAHRGEEVTAEVIDGEQSVVWDQAENRLHAQKALLEFLLT